MQNQNSDDLMFLWDKWKHHDSLAYKTLPTFVSLHIIVAGVVAIFHEKNPLLIAITMILLGGLGIVVFWKTIKGGRKVRNTFNKQIVKILRERGLLENERDWKELDWSVDKTKHPINLWHTPEPFSGGEMTAIGITSMELVIVTLSVLEVLLGIYVWVTF